MKIGSRLTLGFLCVLILMAATVCVGIWEVQQVAQSSAKMAVERDMELDAATWAQETRAIVIRAYALSISQNAENMKYYRDQLVEPVKRVDAIQKRLEGTPDNEGEEKRLLADAAAKRQLYEKLFQEILDLKDRGEHLFARDVAREKLVGAGQVYIDSVEKFQAYEKMSAQQSASNIQETYQRSRIVLLAIGVAGVLIGIIFAIRLTVGITSPLNVAVAVAETVASGDLTSHIQSKSDDETGQLMRALHHMNDSLLQAVSQVRSSADTIAMAAIQVARGNMDLSSRTEEQAGAIEEAVATMENLTSRVRQNGDNARQANQLAAQAAEVAAKGGEAAGKVAQTMNDIDASASRIVDIISVIDGIAFQTNILALNAAVEAARAGEQGRGFAVVASEVRNLAQRSATAAREIKDLIDDSVQKVRVGNEMVSNATETILKVSESIIRVHDIMTEISAATQEQVDDIEQVNATIAGMETMAQQNAALVEESAAASESMQHQAQVLVEVVGRFRTGSSSVPQLSA